MFDCIIVGAGPAGCRTGEIVSKKGYRVLILEEHQKIGEPVQCTGLVSKKIGKIPKEIILNKIKKARFFYNKEFFEINSKEPMFVLDRRKYDLWLAKKAEKAGVKINTSTRFLDFKMGMIFTTRGIFQTKVLVGADGPNSIVAKKSKIDPPKNLLFALQVNLESSFDVNVVDLYFESEIINGFIWIVPENEKTARVGIMSEKNSDKYFEKFLKERFGRVKTYNKIGDVIRYGIIEKSVANNVLLVGDAACQVKPFSGGGLVYNKICSEIAGRAIVKSLEENDFSEKFFIENYDKKWKEKLVWPIKQGLFFKRIFSGFSMLAFFPLIRGLGLTKIADFLDVDFLQK
ncbi:MAG: NAD(P)/FAD-dependent oxidoreductase [Candidatus Aenigmatarchaeota archaeon]